MKTLAIEALDPALQTALDSATSEPILLLRNGEPAYVIRRIDDDLAEERDKDAESISTLEQELDDLEDHVLWAAVTAHQAYRAAHPDEQPQTFDSADEFLEATSDL